MKGTFLMFIYIALFLISVVLGIALTGKNPTKTKSLIQVPLKHVYSFTLQAFLPLNCFQAQRAPEGIHMPAAIPP